MAEPLKDRFNPVFVRDLSTRLTRYAPDVDAKAFQQHILRKGWRELELKGRMSRISDSLIEFLGPDFETNVKILTSVAGDYLKAGYSGFEYMFLPEYIEKQGAAHFKPSMQALEAMTETGSAEFAVRPFIISTPAKSLKQLIRWTKHKNHHVRRLASEGCRPRLPWAMALPELKKDPSPILPILETLKADDSEYVRRSVANNLNDISKDHPELALTLAKTWIGKSKETDWVAKHACRGLLKAGNPDALQLFGWHPPDDIKLTGFKLAQATVTFGDELEFEFTLTSKQALGLLRLEYAIDFVRANGSRSRKVFKISEGNRTEQQLSIKKTHRFVPITTRTHYSGRHGLAIIVNGVQLGEQEFELVVP